MPRTSARGESLSLAAPRAATFELEQAEQPRAVLGGHAPGGLHDDRPVKPHGFVRARVHPAQAAHELLDLRVPVRSGDGENPADLRLADLPIVVDAVPPKADDPGA